MRNGGLFWKRRNGWPSNIPCCKSADLFWKFFSKSIRHELERRGLPMGNNDQWIAAQALALGATLVTDNVREFERVPGLEVENWL